MQPDKKFRFPPAFYLFAMLALSVATISLTQPAFRLGIVWYSIDNPTTGVDAVLKTGEKLTGGSLQRTLDGLIFTGADGASFHHGSIETLVLPPYIEGSPLPITHPKTFLPSLALYVIALTLGWLLYSFYIPAAKRGGWPPHCK